MTAQMNDDFIYKNKKYALVTYSKSEPYNPNDYGMVAYSPATSCWRGYVCSYAIKANYLYLKDLHINLLDEKKKRIEGPAINGLKPTYHGDFKLSDIESKGLLIIFNNAYKDVNLKLEYSGNLFIAAELNEELHVHMGFDQPWKHSIVYELVFENGMLLSSHNRASEMAKIREEHDKVEFDLESFLIGKDFEKTIEQSFNRLIK